MNPKLLNHLVGHGVLRAIGIRCDHNGEGLADMADLRAQMLADIGAGEDGDDAGSGEGAIRPDRANTRMRQRTAHEGRMQHFGNRNVGNESAVSA